MDIGAIASRVKPVPFCQGSVGKNDSAGIRFFFIYAVRNAGNDIITMKTLCIQGHSVPDLGIVSIGGKKVFAYNNFICFFRNPAL